MIYSPEASLAPCTRYLLGKLVVAQIIKKKSCSVVVTSPVEAKDFSSSLFVLISSGVHPASYPKGTGGPFPEIKRAGCDAGYFTPI
jgi:hypothetical protein